MQAIVLDNRNIQTTYNFAPDAGRLQQLKEFYTKAYMNLEIQGYQILDDNGNVVKFGGSI